MTASATSLAPIHPNTNSRRKLRLLRNHIDAIRSEPEPLFADELPVTLPGIFAGESATMIKLLVPLEGIDVRQVYIFATPRSIVLEVLTKCILRHSGPVETEAQRYRIMRELTFRDGLVKRSTAARLSGGNLEITSLKTASTDDEAWSEFIQVDTRSSVGSCEKPSCTTFRGPAGAI